MVLQAAVGATRAQAVLGHTTGRATHQWHELPGIGGVYTQCHWPSTWRLLRSAEACTVPRLTFSEAKMDN